MDKTILGITGIRKPILYSLLSLFVIAIVLIDTTAYAYYVYCSKELRVNVDFPSEPRIKTRQIPGETTIDITDYQSVDKTGVYSFCVATFTPPTDDDFKKGFLETAVENKMGDGKLIHQKIDEEQHKVEYVYIRKIRDTVFTVSGYMWFETDNILIDTNTMFPSEDIKERLQNHTDFITSIRFEKAKQP